MDTRAADRLRSLIADVTDFPKTGILFKDLTPLLADPGALVLAVELMCNRLRGQRIDMMLGAESRGAGADGAVRGCTFCV